jgi:hypothetical protein
LDRCRPAALVADAIAALAALDTLRKAITGQRIRGWPEFYSGLE